MKAYGNAGYHIITNNLQLNTNVISYYNYSFQTENSRDRSTSRAVLTIGY